MFVDNKVTLLGRVTLTVALLGLLSLSAERAVRLGPLGSRQRLSHSGLVWLELVGAVLL